MRGQTPDEPEDDEASKALLDLAKAEAHLREALLTLRVEGQDHVAEAARELDAARTVYARVTHARPRTIPTDRDAKSWGSH